MVPQDVIDALEKRPDLISMVRAESQVQYVVDDSHDASRLLRPIVFSDEQERLGVIALASNNRVIDIGIVTAGSPTNTFVDPKQVLRWVILAGHKQKRACTKFIMAHNHPNGNWEPSKEDIDVTVRMSRASAILGLSLVDHILIYDAGHVSIKEYMLDIGYDCVEERVV